MSKPVVLDDGEKSLLTLAIGIAIEAFRKDIVVLEQEPRHERLIQQFNRQIEEATALQTKLIDADEITLTVVPEEEEVLSGQ